MASDRDQTPKVDRRSFLAASAAGAVAVSAVSGSVARAATERLAAGSGAALSLTGEALGGGWRVSDVQAAEAGAIRVVATAAAGARSAHVLVCRADARSGALATTGQVDLFLLNDGAAGQRLTPRDEVAMVERLAATLVGREASLPGYRRLLPNRERLERFDPIDHADPLQPHDRS